MRKYDPLCCAGTFVLHFSIFCRVNALEPAVESRRMGCGPPAESWLDAIVQAEMGLNLSGPSRLKGKRVPLIAAPTQGGLKGHRLRKERQERVGTLEASVGLSKSEHVTGTNTSSRKDRLGGLH